MASRRAPLRDGPARTPRLPLTPHRGSACSPLTLPPLAIGSLEGLMHRFHHIQLSLVDITKRYGERLVLDRVSFTVKPGEKAGVVGDNGSGKSTLLRLLAGSEEPDNGELTVRSPDGIGHLPQHLDLPEDRTVADAIDLALADLRALESAMREKERALAAGEDVADAYADLLARFESRGGWEADLRV